MFIQDIFDKIFNPFRQLRSTIFNVKQIPQTIKGQVMRGANEAKQIKSEAKQMASSAAGAKDKAKGAAQKAGSVKAPQLPQPNVKKKMGLFSKKVACEGCGQKLHPSWDECPYCGFKKGQGAAAAGGGAAPAASGASGGASPQRTMALDLSAGPIAGTGMLGWIIPLEGARVGELIELRGRITVGKSPDNNVVFDEASISGHHCEFVGSAAGFKLNDLGSTNGTKVNDKRIQTHDLVDNDNVTLGLVRFKFKSLS